MNLLRVWRVRRKLTQVELALVVGTSQQSISYMESGRAEGKISTWRKLCDALDVEMSDLLPRLWEVEVGKGVKKTKPK